MQWNTNEPGILFYVVKEEDVEPKGAIPLKDATVVIFAPEVFDRPLCFGINPTGSFTLLNMFSLNCC